MSGNHDVMLLIGGDESDKLERVLASEGWRRENGRFFKHEFSIRTQRIEDRYEIVGDEDSISEILDLSLKH